MTIVYVVARDVVCVSVHVGLICTLKRIRSGVAADAVAAAEAMPRLLLLLLPQCV